MPRKYTDDQLIAAVAASTTMSGVIRHLHEHGAGGAKYSIKRTIDDLGLDISHFTGLGWSKGRQKSPHDVETDLRPQLRKDNPMGGPYLRQRLIRAGLKDNKCERCGITEWQGEPAPLQLDHIDGDHFNNELENLRILCANCHALTPTWCGKNKGKGRRRSR